VSSSTSEQCDLKAYSSWKVAGRVEDDLHEVHRGKVKSTDGIGAIALDDFCEQNEVERLDFIKIDTDGHELEVLKGARNVVGRFRPIVIFEVGIYVMEERGVAFSDYMDFFGALGYSLFNSSNLREIDVDNYREHIPLRGTIDILAKPDKL
jgi:hypothetical protein